MKTVFSNMIDVANIWAHRLQEYAMSGHIYTRDDSIYSYGRHFEIARWVLPLNSAERIVLFNTDSYSTSTARHQSVVRAALDSDTVILRVPNSSYMFSTVEDEEGVHLSESGFTSLVHLFMYEAGKILEYAYRQKRARSTDYRDCMVSVIRNMRVAFESFELYKVHTICVDKKKMSVLMLDYLNIDNPKCNVWSFNSARSMEYGGSRVSLDGFVGNSALKVRTLMARSNVWVVNIIRELGLFNYTEDNGFEIDDIKCGLMDVLIQRILEEQGENTVRISEKLKKIEKQNSREVAKIRKEREKREKERIEKWREGGSFGDVIYSIPTVMLRLVEYGGEQFVETSRGIRMRIDECRRLWQFWKAIAKRKAEFKHELVLDANGHKWKVNSVDEKGTLKAGCHIIEFSEGLEMAKKLNFEID